MHRAFMIPALLMLACAPAGAQQLPPAVQQNQREAEQDCRGAGGRPTAMPAFRTQHDLNGDGQPDYVHDYTALDCRGAASFFCGSAGCPVVVFVSPAYRAQGLGHAQGWTVDRSAGQPRMVLETHGSGCGRAGAQSCEVRLGWNGREMARLGAGAAQPAPRAAAPAPAPGGGETKSGTPAGSAAPAPPPPGTAWQVRTGGDGRPIAIVAGPGVVQALTVLCHEGVPVAALALRARPPAGPVTLGLAGRGGTATVPLAPGGGSAWFADLRNSPVPRLLAGDEPSLELRINGGLQGRVSLQGSTRSVRDALAPCLRF
jgi:hypothetical protein